MPQPLLSVTLITKNEVSHLPGLLESLDALRQCVPVQLVITDTGSEDGTIEIARGAGAEVFEYVWQDDFAKARNAGLEHCRGEWVLWLDADDIIPPSTVHWLCGNIHNLDMNKVYLFAIVSPHEDGSSNTFSQTRLFPNFKKIFFSNPIHESISPSVKKLGLSGVNTGQTITHTGYFSEQALEQKKIRNQQTLERLVGVGGASTAILFSLARTYQVDGKYNKALALFNEILKTPGAEEEQRDVYIASHIYYGQSLAFLERITEARDFFEQYLSVGKDNPQYQFEFAKVLFVLGEKRRAAECFSQTLHLPVINWTIPTDWESITGAASHFLKELEAGDSMLCKNTTGNTEDHPSSVMPEHISVCSIIKNEIANIPELCEQLVKSGVEWIVADTGSTDGSGRMLEEQGVQVHHFKWEDDFSSARNFTLQKATRPWVLWLDADDRLPEDFWARLREATRGATSAKNQAFRFIVKSFRDTGTQDLFRQVRLFPKCEGISFKGRIHEDISTSLQEHKIEVVDTEVVLLHQGYFTEDDRKHKLDRNYGLLQKEITDHPHEPAVVMEYGNCLYQRGEYHEAIDVYVGLLLHLGIIASEDAALLAPVPENEILRFFPTLIGNTYRSLGNTISASRWYRVGRQWAPEDLQSWYWLGKDALGKNNIDEAMQYFKAIESQGVTISKVATDNATIRRNALGFLLLWEIGQPELPKESIKAHIEELVEGGFDQFPVDPLVPAEYFQLIKDWDALVNYYSLYLKAFPAEINVWENFLEVLLVQNQYSLVQEFFKQQSQINGKSGVLEAFLGKSFEKETPVDARGSANKPYGIYIQALEKFSEDATLLVYFTDWVNTCKNYQEAYTDLLKIDTPSEELHKLIKQLETLA
ncbi:MAG: glycosyltransferase [Fibrobacteria bacterium]|nr:glycosyltransferase [Fibrobacteria bacterium]